MSEAGRPAHRLFSYGTLRQPAVQLANFGRQLEGAADAAIGYRLASVTIDDPRVIAESGAAIHPIMVATGDPADRIAGTVFRLSEAELAAADAYEVDAYVRVAVPLASGGEAWAYVQADV